MSLCPANNKWFSVGGSYPGLLRAVSLSRNCAEFTCLHSNCAGALSAWYRLKYPHMVVGSLASSAVVNAFIEMPGAPMRFSLCSFPAQANFAEFDEQVARSAGPDCAAALRATTAAVEARMPSVKSLFGPGASSLLDGDFWFYLCARSQCVSDVLILRFLDVRSRQHG